MEEQTAPANNQTTQLNSAPPLRTEPKGKQSGKTGLLAAVLIIVVALLIGGFVFLRNNGASSPTPPAPVTQKDELSAGLEQIDQSLKDVDEDTESLSKLNPANDNDPNNY